MKLAIVFVLSLLVPAAGAAQIDSVTVALTGGVSRPTWHGQAQLQALNVELARVLSPRTEVALVVSPMNFHQPRSWFGDAYGDGDEDVSAISGALLIRRHFNMDSTRHHYYVEASTGPAWAEKRVPAATSRFNFVSHVGFGVLIAPESRVPVTLGYRFLHVSNGGYSSRNPGLDISALTLGVRTTSHGH